MITCPTLFSDTFIGDAFVLTTCDAIGADGGLSMFLSHLIVVDLGPISCCLSLQNLSKGFLIVS